MCILWLLGHPGQLFILKIENLINPTFTIFRFSVLTYHCHIDFRQLEATILENDKQPKISRASLNFFGGVANRGPPREGLQRKSQNGGSGANGHTDAGYVPKISKNQWKVTINGGKLSFLIIKMEKFCIKKKLLNYFIEPCVKIWANIYANLKVCISLGLTGWSHTNNEMIKNIVEKSIETFNYL